MFNRYLTPKTKEPWSWSEFLRSLVGCLLLLDVILYTLYTAGVRV